MSADGSRIRLHPNGFIQYDLDETGDTRLHIWSPGLPPTQNPHTPIHNHTFDFESHVLMGRLTHVPYLHCPPYGGDGTYEMYVGGDVLVPAGFRLALWSLEKLILSPGSTYRFHAGEYHDSYSDQITATVMSKTRKNVIPDCLIAVPVGVQPDNDFRRDQYPDSKLMAHVYLVKERLLGHWNAQDSKLLELWSK